MTGSERYRAIRVLETELHSEDCTDERGIELLAAIRKLKASDKPVKKMRKTKEPKEQYMTVLGGYVLDMHDHGHLIGFRDEHGNIVRR